jgi:outer membrane protein
MKKRSFVLTALSVIPLLGFSQEYSLKQCIEYATKANGTIVSANYDVEIAERKVKEQIGTILPQVDGSATYTNNLIITSMVIQGNPIKFGSPHSLSGTVQLTQKIFDPTFPIALKASKISEEQAQQSLKMSKEQSAYSISITYFQTLIIGKQLNTLRSTLNTSGRQLVSTELRLNNGMAKQIDIDKIRVSYNNLKSQVQQSELSLAQSLNNLKYYMGMPVETDITLTDTTLNINDQLSKDIDSGFNSENRTDYQLQKISLKAYEADKARNQAGYLPTLNLTANLGSNAMREKFNFFNSDKWYPNSALTFNLRVPIFDGLQRQQRIAQSRLNIEKSKVKIAQTEQSIKLDLSNYENQFRTAVNNIKNEKDNVDLAENVYKNTQLQFAQGMTTSLDLVQAESSYNEGMNNYYSKLLNLYIARVNLEQAKGNLLNYINNK